ncbi:hypothetical protein [Neolewinella agarilytica]|uniref:Uncharacterized protein n=1 Tax=Neolewinella agarilytica TaxID=478744 RepID=A0A1H9AU54_9BACT|nr:hypothetical protein [Neolewinella agarilytica]SEP80007.1 hypothetical protein SAMN05444359_102222 [Neolewinella agarilytica]
MRYLIFVFMLTSLFGCYNAELTEPTEKPMLYLDRDDFITKTTLSNRSIRFSELDSETQKLFWIDKLDQVRSLAVSEKAGSIGSFRY